MNKPLSIKHADKNTLKQSVKQIAGQIVATVASNRTQELQGTPTSQPTGFRDKLIMAYLKRRAFRHNDANFFERLHVDFWQGEGGAVFSENCDHRFEDLFLSKQKEDFDQLREIWNQRQPNHIVEFGCNSGLLLQHMTTELDGVQSSTGIEINAEQVRQNQESPEFDSRINFFNADGGEWLFNNGQANSLFVSNGGVLEYFRRERLDEMLTHISDNLGPAIFFAVEPIADDHDWSKTTESIPFGEELSFAHNYTDLFESNGFEIVHQRAVEFESWKMMATIAVTE
ncbi:class I SAM-dependent methyltransferase [Mariniblastus sp.]|nr:class I SAM-dependent methyltransferase [Mariniblastus sp.]